MKTRRKRTVISRAVGAGLVIGGAALGVVALAGSPAQDVTDNAQLKDWWINTQGVNTVGITPVNPFPGDTNGNTVVGLPGGVNVTGSNTPGNTIVWFPGGAVVTSGSTFVY